MSENTSNKKPSFGVITVPLTFEGFGKMEFSFRRKLNKEQQLEKQHFLGLSKEEEEKERNGYRIKILSELLTEEPKGVPDYPDSGSIKDDFVAYFSEEDNEELLGWVYKMYQDRLYPKELFSKPSE